MNFPVSFQAFDTCAFESPLPKSRSSGLYPHTPVVFERRRSHTGNASRQDVAQSEHAPLVVKGVRDAVFFLNGLHFCSVFWNWRCGRTCRSTRGTDSRILYTFFGEQLDGIC